MRIVYNRLDAEAQSKKTPQKPKKERKPTAKELKQERANRLIYKMEMRDHKRILKKYADRIAEIKKHFPDWELPRPTLLE